MVVLIMFLAIILASAIYCFMPSKNEASKTATEKIVDSVATPNEKTVIKSLEAKISSLETRMKSDNTEIKTKIGGLGDGYTELGNILNKHRRAIINLQTSVDILDETVTSKSLEIASINHSVDYLETSTESNRRNIRTLAQCIDAQSTDTAILQKEVRALKKETNDRFLAVNNGITNLELKTDRIDSDQKTIYEEVKKMKETVRKHQIYFDALKKKRLFKTVPKTIKEAEEEK